MRPLIGIDIGHYTAGPDAGTYKLSTAYVDAVERAGGAPLILAPSPHTDIGALLERVDGVLLTGGDDFCGEKPHPMSEPLTDRRLNFILPLCRALAENRMPFLAICLGCQAVNVALGGALYYDLPDELPESRVAHRPSLAGKAHRHEARALPGTIFSSLWNATTISINSTHHQALRELARGCRAGVIAPDGVIEGFELDDHPFGVAVQWHPELMTDDPAQLTLFEKLIEAAQ
ncbi:gamma-glutamyl-gamma-aminobutyrate hydrolase family protein [Candidatus Sumerlaeota bacterium]|nr:gamma-glutamyl-gamma-aminobutyrate hydrolase family protein [Candidatus Sumerlaeota bacterium]